jgi:hypothetical protein
LQFDREQTKGYRLNIAAGTAVRFEPGQSRDVELVALVGKREVYGLRACDGKINVIKIFDVNGQILIFEPIFMISIFLIIKLETMIL